MQEPLDIISEHAKTGAKLREKFFSQIGETLCSASLATAVAMSRGGKLLICGNGGSAGDSQHLAGEFVNRFLIERPALPAIALTTDSSILTAVGNDDSFEHIFSRQVEALAMPNDILLAISTSGNSPNVIAALETAKNKNLRTIGLTGQGGGKMLPLCDWLFAVPSQKTPLIQEVHIALEHLYCQLCDYYLFENTEPLSKALQEGNI